MIQIFNDALTNLERRVSEIETENIDYSKAVPYNNNPPFVKCQDRILTLHLRLKLIETENNHIIKQVSNTSGNVLLLQTTINDLATRVKDLEGDNEPKQEEPIEPGTIEPTDPGTIEDPILDDPDEEEDEEKEKPTTNLKFTLSINDKEIQLKNDTSIGDAEAAYYILVTSFKTPDDGIITYVTPTEWNQLGATFTKAMTINTSQANDTTLELMPNPNITIYATTDTSYGSNSRFYYQINNVNFGNEYIIQPSDWIYLDGYFSLFKLLKRGLYNCFMLNCANKNGETYGFVVERCPDGWSVYGIYYTNDEGKEYSEWTKFYNQMIYVTMPNGKYEHRLRVKETATGRKIDIPMPYENAYTMGTSLIYELPL